MELDTLIQIFGCSEFVANDALIQCNGNLERSIDYLLSKQSSSSSLSLPPPPSLPSPPSLSPPPPSSLSLSSSKVTNLEISQYSFDNGSSSCTSICLSVISKLLQLLASSSSSSLSTATTTISSLDYDVHNIAILSDSIIEGISLHNSTTSSSLHKSVDEIYILTKQYQNELTYCINNDDNEPYQGLLNNDDSFQVIFNKILNIIRKNYNGDKHIACVITKPPETICIILPPPNTTDTTTNMYHLFDSHSRPQLGHDGAYLISDSNLNNIITRVRMIWPAFNDNDDIGYMNDMYNMFEVHAFQLKDNENDVNSEWVLL